MNNTEREEAWNKEFNQEWNDMWQSLIMTDGELDIQKIKNELQDLVFIYKQVAEVYCYITGNQLSKPMYYADTIIKAFDDEVQEQVQQELENRERRI